MNQRIKRSKDKKRAAHQDISGSTMNTGGMIVRHDRGKDPEIRVPQKVTGDIPAEKAAGLAKASPLFKKIEDVVKPKSKAEEAKAVAEATTEVEETKVTQPVAAPKEEKKTKEDDAK